VKVIATALAILFRFSPYLSFWRTPECRDKLAAGAAPKYDPVVYAELQKRRKARNRPIRYRMIRTPLLPAISSDSTVLNVMVTRREAARRASLRRGSSRRAPARFLDLTNGVVRKDAVWSKVPEPQRWH